MGNRRDANKSSRANSKSNSDDSSLNKSEDTKKEGENTPEAGAGVSQWLASQEGVGWMQFFVITNAIILLLTTGLPRIWESIDYFTSSSGSH